MPDNKVTLRNDLNYVWNKHDDSAIGGMSYPDYVQHSPNGLTGRRTRMQKWEYLFVSAEQSDRYRVRYINGNEVPAWEMGDDIYTFANKMGDEGWELISAPYTSSGLDWATSRLIFRRPKSYGTTQEWTIQHHPRHMALGGNLHVFCRRRYCLSS